MAPFCPGFEIEDFASRRILVPHDGCGQVEDFVCTVEIA
jgi:hypothetical protein